MFQIMLIRANKISMRNNNPVSIVQMTDSFNHDKAYNEWYKTYTTTNYQSSIHDVLNTNNQLVTTNDWRNVCFAIRFAEIVASDKVSYMTISRINEEMRLVEAMGNAFATEAMSVIANAIDDAWVLQAREVVAQSQERVAVARASEADAVYIYHTAAEKTNAIEMMEELRIAETMSWVWKMTHMDNDEKWWSFESDHH
jgi:hypothetical protein